MVVVLALGEASQVGRASGSEHILNDDHARESSVITIKGFSSIQVVSTAAAARTTSFAGPMMSLMVLTSYDKRG